MVSESLVAGKPQGGRQKVESQLTGFDACVICRFKLPRPSSPIYQITQSCISTPCGGSIDRRAGALPVAEVEEDEVGVGRDEEGFWIVANDVG
jgi:hypothetical protein